VPKPPLPQEGLDLLRRPNPAVIAFVLPDGRPMSVATWYLVEEDARILVNMDAERARVSWMRQDGRVSLTALKDGAWYTQISVRGQISSWQDDAGLADIDRLSRHYGGGAYPTRDRARVSAWIEVDHWHGWNVAPAAD
jgi:PPOX class probable F420-dependent enzyme